MLIVVGFGLGIITDDVDVEWAAQLAVKAVFGDGAPTGCAVNRLIVASAIRDPFIDRFVDLCRALKIEGPNDPDAPYGPLISRNHLEDLTALIETGLREGARRRLGGVTNGLRLPPQVMDQAKQKMAIAR